MKVLFVANYRKGAGGISVQVESLVSHLKDDGYVADICSTKGSLVYRLRCFFNMLFLCSQYDVIHIHACSGRGFLPVIMGVIAGKLCRRRVVLTYHGGGAENFFRKHALIIRFFLKRTDCNIVLSGFIGTVFEKNHLPFEVIPNVIDLDDTVFRERYNIRPSFICIRSHTATYNIPCILKAFQIVKKSIPEATLTLVGDGPLHEDLKKFVRDAELQDVTFVGRVDNIHIYEFLDKADIMLSSPIIDNMPMSLLEGFNAGLLVVSSNVGGVPYMVEDRVSGLLFDSGDETKLSECMLSAISDQAHTKVMIKKAHATLKEYSWKKIQERLIPIYNGELI